MSIGDDLGLRRLAEHPLEPHGGNDTAGQQVAQHLAWPDARQLVGIADEDQLTARADGGEHGPRELGIQHAGLVHDDRVDRQRVPAAVAEAGWASPQQTVDGSGLQADHLAQPLGGLAGRRPQGHRAAERLEQTHQHADGEGLAHARATREDEDAAQPRAADGRALLLRQTQALSVVRQPGVNGGWLQPDRALRQAARMAGECLLGQYQRAESESEPEVEAGAHRAGSGADSDRLIDAESTARACSSGWRWRAWNRRSVEQRPVFRCRRCCLGRIGAAGAARSPAGRCSDRG